MNARALAGFFVVASPIINWVTFRLEDVKKFKSLISLALVFDGKGLPGL
jgi:hypothetical protein